MYETLPALLSWRHRDKNRNVMFTRIQTEKIFFFFRISVFGIGWNGRRCYFVSYTQESLSRTFKNLPLHSLIRLFHAVGVLFGLSYVTNTVPYLQKAKRVNYAKLQFRIALWEKWEMCTIFCLVNLKGKDYLEDLGLDGEIILQWILGK
jgi:hypothetical protein